MSRDEFIGQNIEILVEAILRSGVEEYRLRGRSLGKCIAQQHNVRLGHPIEQLLARGELLGHLLGLGTILHSPLADIVDLAQHKVGILRPIADISARKLRKRDSSHIGTVDVRDDIDLVEPVARELTRKLEAAYRVYLVVEEVETIGFTLRVGEDIEDTSSHRVLSGLVDKVDLVETQRLHPLLELGNLDCLASSYAERLRGKALHIGNSLGKGFGVCCHHQMALPVALQRIENTGAHNHALRLLGTIDHRAFVGRWEEQHSLLTQEGV